MIYGTVRAHFTEGEHKGNRAGQKDAAHVLDGLLWLRGRPGNPEFQSPCSPAAVKRRAIISRFGPSSSDT